MRKKSNKHTKGRERSCHNCGKLFIDYVSPADIKAHPEANCSKECFREYRRKITLANNPKGSFKKKELHPNWKGGVSPINKIIRRSNEYKLWRTAVFERDNYTCVWCGLKSGLGKGAVLHPDHIKPFAYYPELRFAIDNGRTLCIDCHRTTDTYGFKLIKKII